MENLIRLLVAVTGFSMIGFGAWRSTQIPPPEYTGGWVFGGIIVLLIALASATNTNKNP